MKYDFSINSKLLENVNNNILFGNFNASFLYLRKIIEHNLFEIKSYSNVIQDTKNKNEKVIIKEIINKLKKNYPDYKCILERNYFVWKEISESLHFFSNNYDHLIEKIDLKKFEYWINTIFSLIKVVNKNNYNEISYNENKKEILINYNQKKINEILSFKNLISKYLINFPLYQRNFQWSKKKIINFLESKDFVSRIYVSKNELNSINVIDGKQRILSIIIFLNHYIVENKINLETEENIIFKKIKDIFNDQNWNNN